MFLSISIICFSLLLFYIYSISSNFLYFIDLDKNDITTPKSSKVNYIIMFSLYTLFSLSTLALITPISIKKKNIQHTYKISENVDITLIRKNNRSILVIPTINDNGILLIKYINVNEVSIEQNKTINYIYKDNTCVLGKHFDIHWSPFKDTTKDKCKSIIIDKLYLPIGYKIKNLNNKRQNITIKYETPKEYK